ncbi:hypothetical protein Tco_1155031 [Tanacetum coccineum]
MPLLADDSGCNVVMVVEVVKARSLRPTYPRQESDMGWSSDRYSWQLNPSVQRVVSWIPPQDQDLGKVSVALQREGGAALAPPGKRTVVWCGGGPPQGLVGIQADGGTSGQFVVRRWLEPTYAAIMIDMIMI